MDQTEDPWFDESNSTCKEYIEVSVDVIAKKMCFYNDQLVNMSEETQLSLLQKYIMKKKN